MWIFLVSLDTKTDLLLAIQFSYDMDRSSERETSRERWDRGFELLSSHPRRQIIVSLLDVSEDRSLSLPEAAFPSIASADLTRVEIELKHQHLPMLADAGYVQWDATPFRVSRGPRFEEIGAVMQVLLTSTEQLPDTLSRGGVVTSYDQR